MRDRAPHRDEIGPDFVFNAWFTLMPLSSRFLQLSKSWLIVFKLLNQITWFLLKTSANFFVYRPNCRVVSAQSSSPWLRRSSHANWSINEEVVAILYLEHCYIWHKWHGTHILDPTKLSYRVGPKVKLISGGLRGVRGCFPFVVIWSLKYGI